MRPSSLLIAAITIGAASSLGGASWTRGKDVNCWVGCGRKGDSCPAQCGENGWCCRKGFTEDNCPQAAREAAKPEHHSCVIKSGIRDDERCTIKRTYANCACDRNDDYLGKRNFQIVDKINAYRKTKGKSPLECHWALVNTAFVHTQNQNDVPPTGSCNPHSWMSSKHLGSNGKQCCYRGDSDGSCMWKKPVELAG